VQVATEGETPPAVLVTGASTGIGRAVALALARGGFMVFAGVRSEESVAQLHDDDGKLSGASGGIVPLRFDVTDEEAIGRAARTIEERVGPAGLYGLVNNAGVVVAGPMEFLPLDDLRSQLEVNVVGQVAVTQAMLPLLRRAREAQAGAASGAAEARQAEARAAGRIVFVGSISGLVSSRMLGAYAASKFAIEALGDAFRLELEPWGLQVAIVEPGRVRTPIWDKSLGDGEERLTRMPQQVRELYHDTIRAISEGVADVEAGGIEPAGVARAVLHALTARRSRTRYRVGVDAHVVRWLRLVLSDRWMDRFLRRVRR